MGNKITVRELAKRLGVSPAAISIVLNNRAGVSDATRERILEGIKTYGYQTENIRRGSKGSILLIKYYSTGWLVEENQGFVSSIIDSVENSLYQRSLEMNMMIVRSDMKSALQSIEYKKYKGIIIIASEVSEEMKEIFRQIPIPFVMVDNTMEGYPYSSVCMNNAENIRQLIEYCKQKGHTDIGYLRSLVKFANFKERYRAYKQYHSMERDSLVYKLRPSMMGAYEDMLNILDNEQVLPSCFIADNDTIALGAMKALTERGYKIPEEISIIGFDDIPYASISVPALTTMRVQRELIGEQAVNQLIQIIAQPEFCMMKTEISGVLVERGSVEDRTRSIEFSEK